MDTSDLVTGAGYTVVEAQNADEAVRILKERPNVTLFVTDIQMPGSMDGLALAGYVGEQWPDTNILVVSGAVTPSRGVLPLRACFMTTGRCGSGADYLAWVPSLIGLQPMPRSGYNGACRTHSAPQAVWRGDVPRYFFSIISGSGPIVDDEALIFAISNRHAWRQ